MRRQLQERAAKKILSFGSSAKAAVKEIIVQKKKQYSHCTTAIMQRLPGAFLCTTEYSRQLSYDSYCTIATA